MSDHQPVKLTRRHLRAIAMALDAMLAGEDGAGDWDPSVSRRDLDGALNAVDALLDGAHATRGRELKRLRRQLSVALKHIHRLALDVQTEVDAAGGLPGEEPHPLTIRHARDAAAARRFLKKMGA